MALESLFEIPPPLVNGDEKKETEQVENEREEIECGKEKSGGAAVKVEEDDDDEKEEGELEDGEILDSGEEGSNESGEEIDDTQSLGGKKDSDRDETKDVEDGDDEEHEEEDARKETEGRSHREEKHKRRKKRKRERGRERDRDRRKRKKRKRHRSETPSRSPSFSDYSDSFDECEVKERLPDRSQSRGHDGPPPPNFPMFPGPGPGFGRGLPPREMMPYNESCEDEEMDHSGEPHWQQRPPPFMRGRGRGRGMRGGRGRGRGGPMQRQDRRPVSQVPCKFFLEGKCAKGGDCPFNHDVMPHKKQELCKFYLNGNCAKGDQCLFIHGLYPCKFYHTGVECYQGDHCKFSHEPLTDETRPLLEKVLNQAREPIMMPEEPMDGMPRPPLLPTPTMSPPAGSRDHSNIPSLFEIKVAPVGEQGMKILQKQKFQFYSAKDSTEEGSVESEGPNLTEEETERPNKPLMPFPPGMPPTNNPPGNFQQMSHPARPAANFYDNFYSNQPPVQHPPINQDSAESADDSQKTMKVEEDRDRDSDSAASSTATNDSENRNASSQPPKVPMFLAPKQRELFLRIQQKQHEGGSTPTDEEQKNTDHDAGGEDDNWYSSDEDESSTPSSTVPANRSATSQPLTAILQTIRQQVSQSQGSNTAAAQMNILGQILQSSQSGGGGGNVATETPAAPTPPRSDPRLQRQDPRLTRMHSGVPLPSANPSDQRQINNTGDNPSQPGSSDPRLTMPVDKTRVQDLQSPDIQHTIPLDPVTSRLPVVSDLKVDTDDTSKPHPSDPRLQRPPKPSEKPELIKLVWKDTEESFQVEKRKMNAPPTPQALQQRPSDPRIKRQPSERPVDPRLANKKATQQDARLPAVLDPRMKTADPPRQLPQIEESQAEKRPDPRLQRSLSQDPRLSKPQPIPPTQQITTPEANLVPLYTPRSTDPRAVQRSISEPPKAIIESKPLKQQTMPSKLSKYSIPKLPKGDPRTQTPIDTRVPHGMGPRSHIESQNSPKLDEETNTVTSQPVSAYHRLPQVSSYSQAQGVRIKARTKRFASGAGIDQRSGSQFGPGSPNKSIPAQPHPYAPEIPHQPPAHRQPSNQDPRSRSTLAVGSPGETHPSGIQQQQQHLHQSSSSPSQHDPSVDPQNATLKAVFKTIDPTASPFC